MQIKPISTSKHEHMIQGLIIPVSPYTQNCTLLIEKKSGHGIIVDPGGDVPIILRAIEDAHVTIDKIWLTHGHLDHAGGASELRSRLKVEIEGPDPSDSFLLDELYEAGQQEGMPDARNVVPDRWLKEGDEVQLGQATFRILHCPGHTPGSVVFVNDKERFVVGGDVLFRGSVGRTDFPGGDSHALMRSLKKLMQLDDDIKVLCGHGPFTTIGHERKTNPYCRAVE